MESNKTVSHTKRYQLNLNMPTLSPSSQSPASGADLRQLAGAATLKLETLTVPQA